MTRIEVAVCPLPNKRRVTRDGDATHNKGLIGVFETYERYTNTQFLTLGWLRHMNALFLTVAQRCTHTKGNGEGNGGHRTQFLTVVAQRYTHAFNNGSKVTIGHRVRYGMPAEKALRFRGRNEDLDELSLANYSIGRGDGEEL
jgi:hypothetical protein